jgi:peptidyl-prolyl cis-trans isomerase C
MLLNIKRCLNKIFIMFLIGGLLIMTSCESSCEGNNLSSFLAREKFIDANDQIAVIVNGVKIDKKELDKLHQRATEQFQKTGRPLSADLDRKMRGSFLRKIIDDEIIRQKAKDAEVKIDRFERVEALEQYKQRMGGQKGFEIFLKHQNLTEEQILQTVMAEVQREKLIDKLSSIEEPTEEEIKNHYNANLKLYTLPEMIQARHILLKLDKDAPKEKADLVLKKANKILAEASLPNLSFESLVHKYSEGPSVKQGGDLGFFPRGRMVKNFEDMAFNAPIKKAIGPVRTEFGYHIIYVEQKIPSRPAKIEEVRERIVNFIKRNQRARKTEKLLYTWRKSAKIKINDYSLNEEEYKELSQASEMAAKKAK